MRKLIEKIKKSPINYFSDLFIVAMVMLWIIDNVYEALIASAVTISSIILSFKTSTASFDTTMWSSIGTNVAIPLGAGGALWMIKAGVQHAIANKQGEALEPDFPNVEVDDTEIIEEGSPEEV